MRPSILIELPTIGLDPYRDLVQATALDRLIPYADAHHLLSRSTPTPSQLHSAQQRIPLLIGSGISYADFILQLLQTLPFRFILFLQAPFVLSKLYREHIFQLGWIDHEKVIFIPIFSESHIAEPSVRQKLADRLSLLQINTASLYGGLYRSSIFLPFHERATLYPPTILADPAFPLPPNPSAPVIYHFLDFFVNLAEWSCWMTQGEQRKQIDYLLNTWPSR